MMPHLSHLHQPSSSLKGLNLGYDVMEPFAATKALLGAGYHPPSALSLISRMGARLSGASPTAGCSSAVLSSHASESPSLSFVPTASMPPPVVLGSAPAAHHSHTVHRSCTPSPSDLQQIQAPAPADGLLLLLECADGSSNRAAITAQSDLPR